MMRQSLGRLAFTLCMCAVGSVSAAEFAPVVPGYEITFPRDEGSHPEFRTEWWYVTGWLQDDSDAPLGFQVTFFRSRPGLDESNPSRFAAKQVLFAHAAISDPRRGHLLHEEKVAREGFRLAQATIDALDIRIGDWSLQKERSGAYAATIQAPQLSMQLQFTPSQPRLLQGREGFSQKGPQPESASYYYSVPHLQVSGRLGFDGREIKVRGIAWMDHEWSTALLDEEAQGWDWVGLNLDDGGALMVFRMRNHDGGQHGAAATWRSATSASEAGDVRTYSPQQIEWRPLRRWRSPRTKIEYPVEWQVRVGERVLTLKPLMDDQENDARGSTGTIYWEGAVRAFDEKDRPIGRGYLELTGYGGRIRF